MIHHQHLYRTHICVYDKNRTKKLQKLAVFNVQVQTIQMSLDLDITVQDLDLDVQVQTIHLALPATVLFFLSAVLVRVRARRGRWARVGWFAPDWPLRVFHYVCRQSYKLGECGAGIAVIQPTLLHDAVSMIEILKKIALTDRRTAFSQYAGSLAADIRKGTKTPICC